jgi:peptidoglycan/LPS O-acetylase OafA/YrhL
MYRTYIPTLNGWRAVAVSLVIAAHSSTMLQNSGTKIGARAADLFSHAGVGVDIFFSISGFLICTLLLNEKHQAGAISLPSFYIRRTFRILPPLFAYLATLTALRFSELVPTIEPGEILTSALFVRNYFPAGSWYTGHFWTLAIEEHFYLFVPVVLTVLSAKAGLRFAISIVVCCAIIRWAEFVFATEMKVEFRTEARIDAIMYGAIGAFLVYYSRSAIERHLTGFRTIGILAAIILVCYLFPTMPVRRTLMAMAMPIPIVFTVLHAETALAKILELRPIQWIGRLSYSLYIWQMMFLVPYDRPLGILQSFPLAFVCAFACAAISYYLIERPSIRLGHKLSHNFKVLPRQETFEQPMRSFKPSSGVENLKP